MTASGSAVYLYSFFNATRHRGAWREFAEARRSIVANFALSLESPEQLLWLYVTRHVYGLPADYFDKRLERIKAVTREQVQALAQKYLDPERLQIVAVGTSSALGRTLGQFGPVTTYDADGALIDGK